MNDLIEKLKKNEKPFGLLEPEEQECFRKAGKVNCSHYNGNEWDTVCLGLFNRGSTYAIKPDYKPEPEPVDVKIVTSTYSRNFKLGCLINNDWYDLHELPSLPGFFCFWQGREYKDTEHISYEVVATAMDGNQKVYARLRS